MSCLEMSSEIVTVWLEELTYASYHTFKSQANKFMIEKYHIVDTVFHIAMYTQTAVAPKQKSHFNIQNYVQIRCDNPLIQNDRMYFSLRFVHLFVQLQK